MVGCAGVAVEKVGRGTGVTWKLAQERAGHPEVLRRIWLPLKLTPDASAYLSMTVLLGEPRLLPGPDSLRISHIYQGAVEPLDPNHVELASKLAAPEGDPR